MEMLFAKLALAGLLVAASFGGGYYVCDRMHADVTARAVEAAEASQERKDEAAHKQAVIVANAVAQADAARTTRIERVEHTIKVLVPASPKACDLTPDVAAQLNLAGAQ